MAVDGPNVFIYTEEPEDKGAKRLTGLGMKGNEAYMEYEGEGGNEYVKQGGFGVANGHTGNDIVTTVERGLELGAFKAGKDFDQVVEEAGELGEGWKQVLRASQEFVPPVSNDD